MPTARKPATQKPPKEPDALIAASEWPIPEFSGWLLEDVHAALDALGRGSMRRAEQLLYMCMKDPAFLHGLSVRCASRTALPHRLEWGTSRVPAQQRADLEAHLPDLFGAGPGPNSLSILTKYQVSMGPAPVALAWKLSPTGSTWLPTLHAKESGCLTYDATKANYQFQTREGTVDVVPDGKRWIMFSRGLSAYPHLDGILRAAGPLIWMGAACDRWWGLQYNRAHGNPFRRAKVPGKQREGVDAQKMVRQVRDLMGGQVIILPQYADGQPSFDFDLVEAQAKTWETFPAFREYVTRWVTLLWLGAWDNTQGGDTGSRARAEVHERVSQRITISDCTTDAANMRTLWRAWCEYNRIPPEDAPWSEWDYTTEGDRQAQAQTRKASAEALALELANARLLEQAGEGVDYRALGAGAGMPLTMAAPPARPGLDAAEVPPPPV